MFWKVIFVFWKVIFILSEVLEICVYLLRFSFSRALTKSKCNKHSCNFIPFHTSFEFKNSEHLSISLLSCFLTYTIFRTPCISKHYRLHKYIPPSQEWAISLLLSFQSKDRTLSYFQINWWRHWLLQHSAVHFHSMGCLLKKKKESLSMLAFNLSTLQTHQLLSASLQLPK